VGAERGGSDGEAAWFGDARDVNVKPLAWEELRGRQKGKILGSRGQ
jgi:hypothetical protein